MYLPCNKITILSIVVVTVILSFMVTRNYYKNLIQDYEIADGRENDIPNVTRYTGIYRGYKKVLKDIPDLSFEKYYLCMVEHKYINLIMDDEWIKNSMKNNIFGNRVISVLGFEKRIGSDFLKEYRINNSDEKCPPNWEINELKKYLKESNIELTYNN